MKEIMDFQGKHAFMSNFYPSRILYDALEFATVEHAYQAQKTNNRNVQLEVLACKSPGEAKRMGNRLSLRPDWEAIKREVMMTCLRLKFTDPRLALRLVSTGQANIIEGNTWHDNIWGQCVCSKCRHKIAGENLLGLMLMEVRAELRKSGR